MVFHPDTLFHCHISAFRLQLMKKLIFLIRFLQPDLLFLRPLWKYQTLSAHVLFQMICLFFLPGINIFPAQPFFHPAHLCISLCFLNFWIYYRPVLLCNKDDFFHILLDFPSFFILFFQHHYAITQKKCCCTCVNPSCPTAFT